MFTESVWIDCSFTACCSESAKYQTCLIFYRPSTNHAILIPRAKAGDNTYNFLQLPGAGGGGIRRERLSYIQKQLCKAS